MTESIFHISPVWPTYTNIIAERGKGCYIYGQDGQTYLDFTCGIGVTNTGHCHPRVVEAVRAQAGKLLHAQANIVWHTPLLELIDELRAILPSQLDGFFFKNSGSETVEAAVKLARMATGRPNVIVFQGSFHGRTVGAMSLTTSKTVYRARYQPLMPGVFIAPFPYVYRYGLLIEPVLGEGGYVVPPPGFLEGLRHICDEFGILLIVDEIQSGMGRTGRWFAYQHFDVLPDIVIVAKAIASGLPLAGVIASLDLMERWPPGSEGGTYGGNVVACAAGVATVRVMREEGLVENAQARGQELMAGLRHLQERYPRIGDVRGLGLMVGVEFTTPQETPDTKSAKAVRQACQEENLLLLTCGTWDNTIRFIPPLIVTSEQLQDGLVRFERALGKVLPSD
jgi:4-aminobutyrate aminotransferase